MALARSLLLLPITVLLLAAACSGGSDGSARPADPSAPEARPEPPPVGCGGAWRPVEVPGAAKGLAAVSRDDVWAVGYQWDGGAEGVRPLIQRWDGSTWEVVANPGAAEGIGLTDVAAVSADDIWAVGSVLRPSDAGFEGVAAVSASDLWAVGDGGATPLVQRYSCAP